MNIPNYLTAAESIDLTTLDVPRTKSWDRKELTSRNKEVLRLHFQGLYNKDIATVTGFTEVAVSQIIKGTIGQGKLLALDEAADIEAVEVRRRIDGLQAVALTVLEEVLTDSEASRSLRVKTAQDLLDRGGNSRITKVETSDKGYIGVVGIDLIKSRAKELGLVREAEFVSLEPTNDLQQ